MTNSLWAASLAFLMLGAQAQQKAEPAPAPELLAQQQTIPDAPKPQTTLPNVGAVTPGQGSTSTSATGAPQDDGVPSALPTRPATAPAAGALVNGAPEVEDQTVPEGTEAGLGAKALTIRGAGANFVTLPFTVKDSKGRLVPGLTWRDVRVYENGLRQSPAIFTADALPLSVAFVIDQSMTQDNMTRVNNALGAVPGAFTEYDELALFTYNNGPRMLTEMTKATGARVSAALERAKSSGREPLMAGSLSGPMAVTTVVNGQNVDPNTAAQRNHQGIDLSVPKEVHTLNDAILEAAKSLNKAGPDRRRIVYVISDGKEAGSTAKFKDVVHYLNTNNVAVYGTLVGDSAVMGLGFLDRIHLPLMMRDNILPAYASATGGNFAAEFRTGEIEKSFAKIAEEVRNQYTLGYYTHEPFIDGKYRKLEVVVLRDNLTVLARPGYWPSAMAPRPRVTPAQ